MLKKSCAIILSIALAMGILVHSSFAFVYPFTVVTADDVLDSLRGFSTESQIARLNASKEAISSVITSESSNLYFAVSQISSNPVRDVCNWVAVSSGSLIYYNNYFYVSDSSAVVKYYQFSAGGTSGNFNAKSVSQNTTHTIGSVVYYRVEDMNNFARNFFSSSAEVHASSEFYVSDVLYTPRNMTLGSFNPDTRYLNVYKTMSTYGNVRYLCVEVDDIVISSTWISVRFTDQFGPGTYIQDYPFDFFTANGHSYIKIMPDLISTYEFTVTSVVYSGSSSWGIKEVTGLDLTFNEDIFPTPIPSVVPVPDYSYYDTTYINYNGGDPDVIYDCFNTFLDFRVLPDDNSTFYFVDVDGYLYQPFSFTYLAIPKFSSQFHYDSFLSDVIYQYDVVFDELYDSAALYLSFDRFYGTGMYQDLLSDVNTYFTQTGSYDLSPLFEQWYSEHPPLCYQLPYPDSSSTVVGPTDVECSMIVSDSFYFKQTNYLLGDTGDILSELSDRFFKVDGFSDSLFQNLSSMYNLNLQYYDSSLQALTGLSYWLNDNDLSSNLSDITNLLSSLDNYLSSVDGKLNYLVTIDSDLNDLLEWFQNQEDSDVTLTLPDFNPSILIDFYGENIGDFVEFVQDFVDTLPSFDYSDFPNFFDYAADLVDDTAGQGDDLIGSLFQPYDYDDSGLHEFGWD